MIEAKSAPKAGENVWLWLFKIVSGVLIVVILVIHFIVNHTVAQGGLLTWADVVAYYHNPIVPIMEGLFVVLVVPHALIGLRGILLDVRPSPALVRFTDALMLIVGAVAVVYGLWLLYTIASFQV